VALVGAPVLQIFQVLLLPQHSSIPFMGNYRMRYWDIEKFAKKMISISENPTEASSKGGNAYKDRSKWTIMNNYNKFKDYLSL
jgi:hypothetical protein